MWLDLLIAAGIGLPAMVCGSVLFLNYMHRSPAPLFSCCSCAPIVHRPTATDHRRNVNLGAGFRRLGTQPPADGVPSLARARWSSVAMARINYGNNGAF
jgi:hypothetical protein